MFFNLHPLGSCVILFYYFRFNFDVDIWCIAYLFSQT